ncbi:uncharacterized protein LOC134717883 [Mytilus trossulus]|uniref:uncharacterized protein LOC134717883 n=1 Tax=Mytilus trossulus TaxID=6551 RepID=UPI00300669E1
MSKKQKEDYIRKIWTDPSHPAAFAGPDKLYKIIQKDGKFDIGRGSVKRILAKIDTYSVQRPTRKKFKRNRVIVSGIDAQWDGDLASMENVSKYNKYKFLLILIDIFSRYLIVRPLKDKKSTTVATALQSIFNQSNRRPSTIRFDQGGEFKASVKQYLKKTGIHVFYTHNSQIKSNYAERVIRTLKNRIYSYFMENQTYKYIDVLQDLVTSYNNTPHQSLGGATPTSVTKKNEDEIRYVQYLARQKNKKPKKTTEQKNQKPIKMTKSKKKKRPFYKFNLGDHVRVSQLKRVFEKGYQENWTLEYFTISKRFKRDNLDIYVLFDALGDRIEGTFYRNELQKIEKSDTELYKIEKITKKRKIAGKDQVLVKWLGWPSKFNSWVSKDEVKEFK